MMRDINSLNTTYILREYEYNSSLPSAMCTRIILADGMATLSAYKTYTVDIELPAGSLLPYLLAMLYPELPVPEVKEARVRYVGSDETESFKNWFVGSLNLHIDKHCSVELSVAGGNYLSFSEKIASKFIESIRKDLEAENS